MKITKPIGYRILRWTKSMKNCPKCKKDWIEGLESVTAYKPYDTTDRIAKHKCGFEILVSEYQKRDI